MLSEICNMFLKIKGVKIKGLRFKEREQEGGAEGWVHHSLAWIALGGDSTVIKASGSLVLLSIIFKMISPVLSIGALNKMIGNFQTPEWL